MKNTIIIALFCVAALASCKAKKNGQNSFVLTVHAIPAYCEGAQPTDEMLKKIQKPKPFTDTIYVSDNPDRVEAIAIALDGSGKATVSGLAPGSYFYSRFKPQDPGSLKKPAPQEPEPPVNADNPTPPPPPPTMDPNICEMEWYTNEVRSIDVTAGMKKYSDTMRLACDPCALPRP